MTAFVPLPLTLVLDPSGPGALRVAVGGDLRPAALDRLLDVSGTYEHLTGEPATSDRWHSTTPD